MPGQAANRYYLRDKKNFRAFSGSKRKEETENVETANGKRRDWFLPLKSLGRGTKLADS